MPLRCPDCTREKKCAACLKELEELLADQKVDRVREERLEERHEDYPRDEG